MASLALILHAHLPFVRHPEHPDFLEETWLYEAITESYLPLLNVLDSLVRDGVPFALTLSLTPTLCSMLRDPLLMERYGRYLEAALALAAREPDRDPAIAAQARFYHERLSACQHWFFQRWQGDLVSAFESFAERGVLEIITCAATHGFLPLMEPSPEAMRAQILVARDHYRECFGRDPEGIWLPECGYAAGLESLLAEANLRWFVTDAHGLLFGNPRPRYAIYAPCFTPAGPAVFGRDRESSRQVWSAEEGYPGDPVYRDFYRDIGFDLPQEALAGFLPPGAPRRFTGLKYHRITGPGPQKELYHRPWAMEAADRHAAHFVEARARQFAALPETIEPIIVAPFDAELFGHWWFEGPEFLDLVIRKAAARNAFTLTTPGRHLARHPRQQMLVPSASSWGHKGYWEVWLDEANAWVYPHLHAAARRMTEMANRHREAPSAPVAETLRQMARELLLAQASDWAFLMKTGTAREYATRRTREHLLRFTRLYDGLREGRVDEAFLAHCRERDNLFPNLDWRYYLSA